MLTIVSIGKVLINTDFFFFIKPRIFSNMRSAQPKNEDPLVQRLDERFYDLKGLYRKTLNKDYDTNKSKYTVTTLINVDNLL